jgi:hypothetical protein
LATLDASTRSLKPLGGSLHTGTVDDRSLAGRQCLSPTTDEGGNVTLLLSEGSEVWHCLHQGGRAEVAIADLTSEWWCA